jgi:hypothetical protein
MNRCRTDAGNPSQGLGGPEWAPKLTVCHDLFGEPHANSRKASELRGGGAVGVDPFARPKGPA